MMIYAERQNVLWGIAMVIVANIGFSSKAVLIKLMYREGVDVFHVIALRMALALPFYLATLWYLYRQKNEVRLTLRDWLVVSSLGILSYYISSMLDFWGLQYVTASVERLILYTYPTLILLFSACFLHKKITLVQYIAVGLTYVGVAIAFVAEQGLGHQQNFVLGATLIFLCAVTYAVYVVLTGEYVHRIGSVKFTAYAVIAATVPALVQSFIRDGLGAFDHTPAIYGMGFCMAVIATVMPTFMIVEGIRRVGAGNAGIFGFIGPVSTIVMAYFLLDEPITTLQLLGTAVVLAGVGLLSWKVTT
jgi:drug/metabolite transporter (DMT)-like permease